MNTFKNTNNLGTAGSSGTQSKKQVQLYPNQS